VRGGGCCAGGVSDKMANERARSLRRNSTNAERRLWYFLRGLKPQGHKFRRQVPIDHYIFDFACLSARLVIELDGTTHSTDDEIASDRTRQAYVESQGFRVLRFWNTDVYHNSESVMDTIVAALSGTNDDAVHSPLTPTPDPSPQGGGE
ncbi:MAG: endonuclease domain-containing protein, partial [Hyphomicrobiaceae bacterium]